MFVNCFASQAKYFDKYMSELVQHFHVVLCLVCKVKNVILG